MLTKEEIERRIDAASKTPTEATCCMDLVKLACEAADEIERLQAKVKSMEELASDRLNFGFAMEGMLREVMEISARAQTLLNS